MTSSIGSRRRSSPSFSKKSSGLPSLREKYSDRLHAQRAVNGDGRDRFEGLDLQAFIPELMPKYESPRHLKPFTDRLELAIQGIPQRVVVHAPPRHGKTETILHAIPYGLKKRPDMMFGYASYNSKIAHSKSFASMNLALRAGVPLIQRNRGEWLTAERGGCLADGVGGAFTGFGLHIALVDDAIKNRVQAESPVDRQTKKEWLESTYLSRLEPGGSCFIFMTRWHPDDLAGFAINEKGFEYVCLPALSEDGDGNMATLWPERWPVDAMLARKKEVGPYSWESLYQGAPRPRGGAVFGDPWAYRTLPNEFQVAIGLDLAYSKKTSSDWSVAVVMYGYRGMYWIAEVYRQQVQAPQFLGTLQLLHERYPHARWRWYASGTEKGAGDFIKEKIKKLEVVQPPGDKFVRSIGYAAAWNANKVFVPEDNFPWVEPFLSEHADFTGVNDLNDDQVDAGVAAYDLLAGPSVDYHGLKDGRTPGPDENKRRM